MKTNKVTTVIFLMALLSISSCKKNDPVDLTPKSTIDCAAVGLGDDHPKSADYQKILDKYVGKGLPGVTAAIYTAEDGLWVGAAGLSDIKNQVAMNTCNVLFSGSVAKMYTVTAAMVLYEQGKLDLDAKISDFLPQNIVDNLPNAKTATIRQLMNHSAGMPDHDDDEALSDYIDSHNGSLPSAEKQLEYLFDDAPLFEPGEKAVYSSAHTLTLSLVIDKIAGKHHSNVISKEIIQKIGLTETYYKNETGYPRPKNLVNGHYYYNSKNIEETGFAVNYCEGSQGDAGLIASVNDYYLFLRALMEGRIVSQSTLDLMLNNPEPVFFQQGFKISYGLGLFILGTDQEVNKIGHSGVTNGGMTHLYHYPTVDGYIAIATNTVTEGSSALQQYWYGSLVVGGGGESIVEEIEALHFD